MAIQNADRKIRVAVLFGGVSSEHEVSLASSLSVLNAIPQDKYEILPIGITKDGRWLHYTGAYEDIVTAAWEADPALKTAILSPDHSHKGFVVLDDKGCTVEPVDICFPVLHGKNGEDGTIQGLLQLCGLPFVGCDAISSACCMDKETTHILLEAKGVRMAKYCCIRQEEMANFDEFAALAEEKLSYPMFVKPANAGSSVGVSKAKNRAGLHKACVCALAQDSKAIVEEYIDGIEVETAVLGNSSPKAAGFCGELTPLSEFYTYEAKYIDGTTELHIPARIPEETATSMRDIAEKAYTAMGCAGMARVDFFVCRDTGEIVLNELNTIPGFTSISMYPKLWDAAGLDYPGLVDRLIGLGLER